MNTKNHHIKPSIVREEEDQDRSVDIFPLPNIALKKHHGTTTNRLAPYNPTHVTAREKALDLLDLSNNDVLFDLGCGDGRLLFTAMECFYDDEYLLRQHQKIFNVVTTTTTQQPPHESDEIKEVTFYNVAKRQSFGNQSHSSLPHMMCDASDDDEDDDDDEESYGAYINSPKNKIMSLAWKKFQKGLASPVSPLHSHPMPSTPITSNRKKDNRSHFPTPHLSPIFNKAASEEIHDIPLTITASSSDEKANQEEIEASPSHEVTLSDIPTFSSSSSSNTVGLRCVGIEYDQALVEAANNHIDTSFKMFESFDNGDWVKKRLCIRWGCVFDEWNFPDLHGDVYGKTEQYAQHLSLLEDATAVFVYLLPEGLKKVKPLLLEAARRRREQMHNDGNVNPTKQEDQVEQTHRKDYSHVSDITDYDFMRCHTAMEQTTVASSPPAFRVVSYMFSIPDWTPTKVDRSSKGACPLYLYENLTEEF
jgi:hypothetical protein